MKKLILSKTILFIFILAFINLFIVTFGGENTLIGVTVITATLMLLERDLTISPLKNTLKLVLINIFLGILSFVAIQNIFLGIACNFISLFVVGYLFSYDLRSPIYIAFGLQYLFMVSVPITVEQLPLRILSLISGALIIMVAQMIVNKNKLEKTSDKLLSEISNDILQKINRIVSNEYDTGELDFKIDSSLKTLKRILYDNRKEDFFMTNKGMNILNIIFNFERISTILDKYKNDMTYTKYSLSTIQKELYHLRDYMCKDGEYKRIYIQDDDCIDLYEFYDSIENIYSSFNDYRKNNLEKELESKLDIPHEFKMTSVHKRNLTTTSIRFSYAIKVSVGVAIAGFLMDYLKLSEGRWIMFTVFSLVQPYSENCIIRSKKRIFATFIGGLLVLVLFSIFKSDMTRSIIIILAGYISTYTKDYRDLIMCNTISAIGAACAATSVINPGVFVLNRILFILLGAFIALIINKLLLPYNAQTAYDSLIDMYKKVISEMDKEITLTINKKSNLHKVKNLFLIANLIEDKMISMNTLIKDDNQDVMLNKKRFIINNMYSLYLNLKSNNNKKIKSIFINNNSIMDYELVQLEEAKDIFLENLENTSNRNDKLIYVNMLNILEYTTTKELLSNN